MNIGSILRRQGHRLRERSAGSNPGGCAGGVAWRRAIVLDPGDAKTHYNLGFVLSDHADWPELHDAIRQTGAERIFATHGYTEIFARWLNTQGYQAEVVPTEFGGEEDAADAAEDAA